MPLPLIENNMFFDDVLKAIESTLKAESDNQIALGGKGWVTVRERFDPWNVDVDDQYSGVVNVSWSSSNFPGSEGNNFDQTSNSVFEIDCYAAQKGKGLPGGSIIPKDQNAAILLHEIITKVYYTIMSPVYYDLGLTPGTIVRSWVSNIIKFIPTESNIPIVGIIAARMTCNIKFEEIPPQIEGVDLEVINIDTDRDDDVDYVDQTVNL